MAIFILNLRKWSIFSFKFYKFSTSSITYYKFWMHYTFLINIQPPNKPFKLANTINKLFGNFNDYRFSK